MDEEGVDDVSVGDADRADDVEAGVEVAAQVVALRKRSEHITALETVEPRD